MRFGSGDIACNGQTFVRANNRPTGGATLVLSATGGPPNFVGVLVLGVPLPGGLPMPQLGTTVWIDPGLVYGSLTESTDSAGYCEQPIALPTSLIGHSFSTQMLWLSSAGCGAAFLIGSNAIDCTVQ